jgi:hypothetical protein
MRVPVSRSINSISAVALNSRLRTSRPSAMGRVSGAPSISRGTRQRQVVDHLIAQILQRRIAVDRPAPEGPVTRTTVRRRYSGGWVVLAALPVPSLGHFPILPAGATPCAPPAADCINAKGKWASALQAQGLISTPSRYPCRAAASSVSGATDPPVARAGCRQGRRHAQQADPRASICPDRAGGQRADRWPSRRPSVRSSATRPAPSAISCSASPDLPDPEAQDHIAPSFGHASGVQDRAISRMQGGHCRSVPPGHTGRPTTKRAPSGSDVGRHRWGGCSRPRSRRHAPRRSASRSPGPRPEWLPNWPGGRSE